MTLPAASCGAVAATAREIGTTVLPAEPDATTAPSYIPYGALEGTLIVAVNAVPLSGVVVTQGQSTFL